MQAPSTPSLICTHLYNIQLVCWLRALPIAREPTEDLRKVSPHKRLGKVRP